MPRIEAPTQAHPIGSMRTPGFSTPFGSSARLAAVRARAKGSGRSMSYQGRCIRPTAWWWVIVPPAAITASDPPAFERQPVPLPGQPLAEARPKGVIGRRAVGVDVREAAVASCRRRRSPSATAAVASRTAASNVRPAVPRDRRLEGAADQAERRAPMPPAAADERVGQAPTAPPRPVALPASSIATSRRRCRRRRHAPLRRACSMAWRCDSSADSNADDQHRLGAVEAGAVRASGRIEEAQVGRPQLGLGDLAGRLVARPPRRRRDAGGGPERGPGLHAHPRLADNAEDPLAADDQAVRVRPRARAGQAARLPPARGVSIRTVSTNSSIWVWLVA